MKKIDLAQKIGFAFTCSLSLEFAAHDAMMADRYSEALAHLQAGNKAQLVEELRFMMRQAGV